MSEPPPDTELTPTPAPVPPAVPVELSPSQVPAPELPPPPRGSLVLAVTLMAVGTVVVAVLVGAIAVAGVMAVRAFNGRPHPPAVAEPTVPVGPVSRPPPALTRMPAAFPPIVSGPATGPAASPQPVADAGPWVASMESTTGQVGDKVVLRGYGLAAVDDVVLFPQHGGAFVEVATFEVSENEVSFAVPAVERAEGAEAGDGYYVGVFAKTGAALLVDRSFHITPWGTGGNLSHDAIHVRAADPFEGRDHLLVFADPGSTVSVGDACVVFLGPGCTLNAYGPGCKVFYQPPLSQPASDGPVDGLTALPSVRLNPAGGRLFLKPLQAATEPADDPN